MRAWITSYNVIFVLRSPFITIRFFISTEIEWLPINSVKISKEKNNDIISFLETLEDDDDIQNVYSNAEFGM